MRSRDTFLMVTAVLAPLVASAADLRVGITRYDGGSAKYGIAENQQIICDRCPSGPELVPAAPRQAIRFDLPPRHDPVVEVETFLASEESCEEPSEMVLPSKKDRFSVFFGFNKAVLTAAEKRKLRVAVAEGLDPSVIVRVDGYTCRIGTETYNRRLSKRRAKAVAGYLRSLGVTVSVVEGMGEKHKHGVVVARDRRAEVTIKERN